MITKPNLEPALARPSIDWIRVIRRSMRCYVFGLIGLVPLFGAGLAVQALRLQRKVNEELGQPWNRPFFAFYWIVGLLLLWWTDGVFGLLGDLVACLLVVGVQSWHVWRSFPADREAAWNPGRREVIWGVVSGYAGLAGSIWTLALVAYRIVRLIPPA
jgi:hypothetical protein